MQEIDMSVFGVGVHKGDVIVKTWNWWIRCKPQRLVCGTLKGAIDIMEDKGTCILYDLPKQQDL